ncbi:flagellar assembly protein FliW [Alteribacter natronophilus]|nr:flagellar assembly protein FliW [Alteribacter natronophilus]TMW72541.1 flagellar assembly protein FliW [Alteribacter natronophilus]
MNVSTKYMGSIEIDPQDIVFFPQGLPSFENERQFVLLPFGEQAAPFFQLQSVDTPDLAFVLADPFLFFPDYEVKLNDSLMEKLHIVRKEDVSIFVMLTVQSPFEKTTANLKGPLVINNEAMRGSQFVLQNPDYTTRHGIQQPAAHGGR